MKKEIQEEIVEIIKEYTSLSSKEIHEKLLNNISYATVKRYLNDLISLNLITATGKGKARKYKISQAFNLISPVDTEQYFDKEIDERNIITNFNFDLIHKTLSEINLFTYNEKEKLTSLQVEFTKNLSELNEASFKKEMERLAIDLSWKSSQIEGNTYTLLETERLLKEKETAEGKTKEEAIMLLNHKEAIDYLVANSDYLSTLSVAKIENIHSLLVKDLGIDRNIRKRKVGITGTNYTPLDNEFQIRESLEETCNLINNRNSIFEKALLALVMISYIQPFSDGNKRTARITSNAILMNFKHCPISFRTVDSVEYKKAMLIFYEQNNISAFKKIFIEQFEFAVKTYF